MSQINSTQDVHDAMTKYRDDPRPTSESSATIADAALTAAGHGVAPGTLDQDAHDTAPKPATADEGTPRTPEGSDHPRITLRVELTAFDTVDDDVPTWAWEHDGRGRIPVGGMTLFAGRPAAGKSTSARWFAAQVSRGTLPGAWQGQPHGVAYIAAEESAKYSVKPSLRAAGADTSRVYFPETVVQSADDEAIRYSYVPAHAMGQLAATLKAHDVRLVVVDPLMATLGGDVDAHRSNEVRERLKPWVDLAEEIDGVVLGIVHLNKSSNGDIVAGINGSSAFGELARAAFGFVKDPDSDDGDRVMSQEKNSLGSEDLALTYRLDPQEVTTSSGKTAEMPRFTIVGPSDRSAGEILRSNATAGPDSANARQVVMALLEANGGVATVSEVKAELSDYGLSYKTAANQRDRWGIVSEPVANESRLKQWRRKNTTSEDDAPRQESLPTGNEGGKYVGSDNGAGQDTEILSFPTSHPECGKYPGSVGSDTLTRTVDLGRPEVVDAILDILSADHEVSVGKLMRTVKGVTGDGSTVGEVLDRLQAAGRVTEGVKGGYLLAR